MKTKLIIAAFATVKTTSKNIAVACLVLLISVGSIKGQWTPGTGNAIDTYWSPTTNSVAIGINQPAYKLHVVDDNSAATNNVSAGYFDYSSPTNATATYYGIRAICADPSGNTNTSVGVEATAQDGGITNTGDAIGFQGNATISGSGDSYGGNFTATGGNIAHGLKAAANTGGLHSYGVFGSVNGPSTLASSINSGVVGEGSGTGAGIINAGVLGKLNATGAAINAAVYGNANGYSGGSDWAGYFNGNVFRSGSDNFTSDEKLKENIRPIVNPLEKIRLLNPSMYNFKKSEFKGLNLPDGLQFGLIAQNLEKVFPELVKEVPLPERDENGNVFYSGKTFKTVQYINLIPILISAIQEQQQEIQDLKKQIFSQKQDAPTSIEQLSQYNSLSLEQNVPNPFTHETTIQFSLPQSVNNAQLLVYDLAGKQITSMSILERGDTSLAFSARDLVAGIYLYAIVADGKMTDTKRMVVADK